MYNICWGKVFIGCVPARKKQSGSEYWVFHQSPADLRIAVKNLK